MSEITKGIKYGCGGTVGVIIALTVLPLVLLGGCLLIGGVVGSHDTPGADAREIELAAADQHAAAWLLGAMPGCEKIEDVSLVRDFQEPHGETRDLRAGTQVRVRGKGRSGCRRVELDDGTRWWLPGSTLVRVR